MSAHNDEIDYRIMKSHALIESIRNESGEGYDVDEISDADSDMLELENDIEKYNRSVHEFLMAHRGDVLPAASKTQKPKGPLRGPRKAAEPRGDIKARLSKANQAFLNRDYPTARNFIFEVIRINAETHQAWTTLASIFKEENMLGKALMSMVYGAHLRPKDVASWLKVARFALSIVGQVDNALTTARLCYSAALRADPRNIEARLGRAEVCLEQRHVASAIADYRMVLNQTPLDINVIRKLAEASLESPSIQTAIIPAISAYTELITFETTQLQPEQRKFDWGDVIVYTELLSASQCFEQAVYEVKRLSRWLLTGSVDSVWDTWSADDREFDLTNSRRQVAGIKHTEIKYQSDPLPIELRVQLGLNRLRLQHFEEGLMHLYCLHPNTPGSLEIATRSPYLMQLAADQIFESGLEAKALPYYQAIKDHAGFDDPSTLYQLGRCFKVISNLEAAEEYFLATIESDESHIDARIELATIYEEAKEGEEALILVTEALALRNAINTDDDQSTSSGTKSSRSRRKDPSLRGTKRKKRETGMLPSRFRTKRLGDPNQRRKAEQERMKGLIDKYGEAQELRCHVSEDIQVLESWVNLAKELIDDFRSSKKFYTWDRYLKLLNINNGRSVTRGDGVRTELDIMAERLSKAILPQPSDIPEPSATSTGDNYLGILFTDWLDLFLDYAIYASYDGNYEESASVCHAARDSTVFRSSIEFTTRIYLAWAACAAYSGDEEACVFISRNLIRDNPMSADAYRMFAIMSRMCQSTASWYNSGPAQKFLLRQIKAMDCGLLGPEGYVVDSDPIASRDPKTTPMERLPDVTLLMLYGHILFMSTSYTYALHYFLRARSLDEFNPAINLSIGLGYIHYALKRQSVNRQYLILQGLSFVFKYRSCVSTEHIPEADYNVRRVFCLIGLPHLADTLPQHSTRLTAQISNALTDLELQDTYNKQAMEDDLESTMSISKLIL